LTLRNRMVAVVPAVDASTEGVPGDALIDAARRTAREGAGLVVVGDVAVAPDARTTSGSPGLYGDPAAWAEVVEAAAGTAGARLTHAGRRGATRPRSRGLDRPLREGAWDLVAASPLAYGSNATPREATRSDMDRVRDEFVAAAENAAVAGFDALGVELARGHLLGSFLSPLSNRRSDGYGAGVEGRARFPLEVFEAVRERWTKPLFASLAAADGARGGVSFADVLWVARALRDAGCDLLEVTAGGTIPDAVVPYDPYTLPSYADRIRNETGMAVMLGGAIAGAGRVNTLVASGRADLCILMPPRAR
ncbi:MAG: bifunctional salicylyl-CoA 5-hydroxylase/oxidoreductase, partial [Actinomycetota bacterium]|nr:bifunctional salicylyl-CoA 5-hydroxylase/oxidoreductase [Actinomycetota bacterium]